MLQCKFYAGMPRIDPTWSPWKVLLMLRGKFWAEKVEAYVWSRAGGESRQVVAIPYLPSSYTIAILTMNSRGLGEEFVRRLQPSDAESLLLIGKHLQPHTGAL